MAATAMADATIAKALSEAGQFGLKPSEARAQVRDVATVVSGWKAHFGATGVRAVDIEMLAPELLVDLAELEFCVGQAPVLRYLPHIVARVLALPAARPCTHLPAAIPHPHPQRHCPPVALTLQSCV